MPKYNLAIHASVGSARQVFGSFHETKEEAYEYLISFINNEQDALHIHFIQLEELHV